ncbi:MAG: hypothetical protein JRH18_08990 [Deltaproteobacteria bacterium]|nr:hypothetical protein [Deltaproteobacteria bacterium]MBW2151789.1 hypothetical protein [Deltaproteobacteria bacterium]
MLKEIGSVSAVFKDRFPFDSTDDDMMQGSWSIWADFARYGLNIIAPVYEKD